MGYRRDQWRSAQLSESTGQWTFKESREFIPAPIGGVNYSLPKYSLSVDYAVQSHFLPTEIGYIGLKQKKVRAVTPGPAQNYPTIIPFFGSASASAKLIVHDGAAFYDMTGFIDSNKATATASISVSVSVGPARYDYIELNNRLIMTQGSGDPPLTYSNASAFKSWSATASGDSIINMWGINNFKSRIFCWKKTEPKFFYGTVDAVQGTLQPFNLAYVVSDGARYISTFFGMTRDGGSGPDDFAVFIMDNGETVVYQGTDPSSADTWSLVGVYKIGKPLGRNCAVSYGSQVAVACDDDIYFLPQDLEGKRQPSKYAYDRSRTTSNSNPIGELDGTFWSEKGWIIWEDGTVINTRMQGLPAAQLNVIPTQRVFDAPTVFNDRLFYSAKETGTDDPILCEFHNQSSSCNPLIVMPPIRSKGRGNMSMIKPVLRVSNPSSGLAGSIIYSVGVIDDYASASAVTWSIVTCSSNNDGLWSQAFGTGDAKQIQLRVTQCSFSTSSELVLIGFDITYSDTGGI